jgi:hypothetical protein
MCGARHDDVTSIICDRERDHFGDHEGTTVVTWPREDDNEQVIGIRNDDGTIRPTDAGSS